MVFSTDWDVEKYKTAYETAEHWELRKAFLLKNKMKFPEDRLICLAQVFFNVELMGCKYPEKTMELVKELSEEIADSFREKRQNSDLQRSYVGASDAAISKAKRTRNN